MSFFLPSVQENETEEQEAWLVGGASNVGCAVLRALNFTDDELKNYLSKITDDTLYAYNVYKIEGEGRKLFASIEGDEDTIMGLPIKRIKEYLGSL